MLQTYSGGSEGEVFSNASKRQRTWLTNALANLDMLGEALRGCFAGRWTGGYPSLELRFQNDDGYTIQAVLRFSTPAQQASPATNMSVLLLPANVPVIWPLVSLQLMLLMSCAEEAS